MSYGRQQTRTSPSKSPMVRESRNANYPEPYRNPPVPEEIPMPGGIRRVDYH